MFKFINFNWLIKLIYYVAKFSSTIYISIDFSSEKVKKSKKNLWNTAIFVISFGGSLAACSFNSNLPIFNLTHSRLLEMIVYTVTRSTIGLTLVSKLSAAINRKKFFEIISNMQWVDKKVN